MEETSDIEVINVFSGGGYRGSSALTVQQPFGYLCAVRATFTLPTLPVVFVNKSLTSQSQRLL